MADDKGGMDIEETATVAEVSGPTADSSAGEPAGESSMEVQ